jgi:FMS-like tyrosine kinase 1
MPKKKTDDDVIKALVSELKISIFVGKHINIVNLLGAVTENITKRELMVIFEYCRYGNFQIFLVQNRYNFIDQVTDDEIDPTIQKIEIPSENHYEPSHR